MRRTPTYRGGIAALLARYEGRRDPFDTAPGEGLPPEDIDLAALACKAVQAPEDTPSFRSSFHRKRVQLATELAGRSQLCLLNALLISHLRKRSVPEHAPRLFHRLWAEQSDHLLDSLDARWLVSSVTTFGDHGLTPVQRATGLALTALFGTMKLYESERLYSGTPPDQPHGAGKLRAALPLDMDAYALAGGGLDVNLIARLWQEAAQDAVIAPLAHHLIDLMIHDPRTVFSRFETMRRRKAEKAETPAAKSHIAPVPVDRLHLSPQTLRWGLVATVKAPLAQIARFAAHHLDMGAQELHLYLDAPDPEAESYLARHPRIRLTRCDDAYWQATGKPRPDAHQRRQALNATRALAASAETLDWLGHVDVDEFLIAEAPLPGLLAQLPPAHAVARIPPAEALAREGATPCHFKLTHAQAGVPKARLQDIYPTFGMHLYGGFLSHTSGKILVRTGIPDTRLGIHALKYRGAEATNRSKLPGVYVAHFHAPEWAHFRDHLAFRQDHGSYRRRADRPELGQAELFRFLSEEEGEDGLRLFFDEVCADTPELRARLEAQGMLLTHRFDFDATVKRVFGRLP
ncbi:glycosyltransferase family 2 protein [Pseudoponticoccus marisrubri]|uniref:Glycosyl transferase family 2 n=1 Tax=Pseudoponticoccus marisrubri TaxID=1685382 RepID=A0A0W7WES6_9RHOB|nr:glycosyltransferase family 2 protein [Pseudoponticoccus marisrubri]KUF09062.1 hypothetical protein AVJ23_19235 [Pseudoponticoccus marisrubri]